MVAGHLQKKKGNYYIVMNYKNDEGKRKTKWIATGLPTKGNKKKAEAMLQDTRKSLETPSESDDNEATVIEENAAPAEDGSADILFADFMEQWLEMMKHRVEVTTHAAYTFGVNGRIVPYFREKSLRLLEIQLKHLHVPISRKWTTF